MSNTKSSGPMIAHARKVLEHQQQQVDVTNSEAEAPAADTAFLPTTAYAIKKRVTTPVLPFPTGATYVLRIMTAVRTSEVEDSKFGPARVCEVEAPNGEVRLLIVGEVLSTALARSYPSDAYVGAWFQITKLPPKEGKRGKYADYAIAEIEGPGILAAAE